MKRLRRLSKPDAPDMTAMMDIVFILIIFFFVTASFQKELGIEFGRPDGRVPPNPDQKPSLVFELGPVNTVMHEGALTDVWSASALMKQFHTEHEGEPVVLRVQDGAQFGMLVRLHDAARKAGYRSHDIQVL